MEKSQRYKITKRSQEVGPASHINEEEEESVRGRPGPHSSVFWVPP